MTLLSARRSVSAADERSNVRQPETFRQERMLRQATLQTSGHARALKRRCVCVVKQIAGKVRQLQNDSSATSACRCVGTRTARPGEASSAATKFQTTGALHRHLMTRE